MASDNAPGSAPETPSPANRGIDWRIFNDSEDDAFGWLLRSTAGFDAMFSDASALSVDAASGEELERVFQGADDLLSVVEDVPVAPVDNSAPPASAPASASAARIFSGLQPSRKGSADATRTCSAPTAAPTATGNSTHKSRGDTRSGRTDATGRKLQRRERNLESVRAFRKRKATQVEQSEAKLRRLEAEHLDLQMRLKIGKEALATELRDKQLIKEHMRALLARGAAEHEVAQFLDIYRATYADYGPTRRDKLRFHLASIRELLLPTQVTKLCLYSVEQGDSMLARDSVLLDDPMAVPDSAAAAMSLWTILAQELDVSEAQQRQLLQRRQAIRVVLDDLEHALAVATQLEEVTDSKNTALEAQVAELQRILTPTQATKFIIWVKENPAFMYMLDTLVDSTLSTTDA